MLDDQLVNPKCPKIPFTDDEIKSFYKPWSKALVVKVLEKSFSFLATKRRLEYLWAKSGSIQVSDLANNFYLVRFASQEDYSLAAFKGPWKIYDYYFSVSQWSPSFDEEAPIQSILTWVRLPKLPIHYFNELAVSRIGNCIGRTIRLDLATAEGTRGRYARVCVEVDLTKPLLGKYIIEDRVFKVEYESLENMCFDCGMYGHKRESCSQIPPLRETEMKKTTVPGVVLEAGANDPDVGEWMTVQRRHRKKSTPPPATAAPVKKGSNFSVLEVEETEIQQADTTQETSQEELLKKQTEKLRKVLEDALTVSTQKQPVVHQISAPDPRPALKNVTNVEVRGGTGQTNLKAVKASQLPEQVSSASGLVSVPVMFQNLAFQADLTELTSCKPKPTVNRKNMAVKSKMPVAAPNSVLTKKRTVKKKSSATNQVTITEPISKDNETDVNKTRKPPDRS
ncbi:hypothetical protein LINPERHAP1_LOCUS25900 [Linum perenne]